MNERLTILTTYPKVVFESSDKPKKNNIKSIQRELKWSKFVIPALVLLALMCFTFIVRELISVYVLETREYPKSSIWMFFLFAFQPIFGLPQLWMQRLILNHKLDLLQMGERDVTSSLNDQLKDILIAKKGVWGAVLLIPVFFISIIAAVIESTQVIFEPYFVLLSVLLIIGFLLSVYDSVKYDRLFRKNVELYNNLV